MPQPPSFTRRSAAAGLAGTLAGLGSAAAPAAAPVGAASPKVLRYAFEVAETSFDPAKIQDLYSRTLTAHIFENLYTYDHLARPVKLKPLTAAALPEVSADFTVWTMRIRPGIFFADDPAFGGKPRELVAADYVWSLKRYADPALKSPAWSELETARVVGLAELRRRALDGEPFDYDREIAGLRALDRHTLRFVFEVPRPRFVQLLASSGVYGAMARDVVAFYGERADEHPVGTGPFRLAQWRRSSFIALDRNPGYRERVYDAEPTADDAEGRALAARFRGRRLPMVDRVEVSIIEEDQPRWLAFVNGEADLEFRLGYAFVDQAMPNGKVAPGLAKRGVRGYRNVDPTSNAIHFNMTDPLLGGLGAARVALRRAIALGMDDELLIRYAYNGLGRVPQTAYLPFTTAYDPTAKSEFGSFDPARAKALLDLYGYLDRDGDGWREQPDGSPLVLTLSTQSDQRSRRITEVMDRNMRALGLRLEVVVRQWPENLKAARAGRLQMWSVGSSADQPDAIGALARYDSRQIGGENFANARLPGFDALYDRLQTLPDGPERQAAFRDAERLAIAYMPYKVMIERMSIDMAQPQLVGYRKPVFWNDFWQYVDIDRSLAPAG